MTQKPTSDEVFYARTFALLAILVLAYLVFQIIAPLFAPIAWAFFIAFLLQPLHRRLAPRLGGRPGTSAALLTVAALLLLAGPLAVLAAAFTAQVTDLLRSTQQFVADNREALDSDITGVPVLGPALAWVQESTGVSLAQIEAWLREAAVATLKSLASLGRTAVLGALGTLVGLVVMMFVLFFAIRDAAAMFAQGRALIPMPPEDRARLFKHLGAVTRAMVYGVGLTALIQGALVALGFAIAGLPSPVVFGVLAALFALVPLAGTPVVWGPAVIVLAANGRWGMATFLLAWGLFVTTIDNFLRPLLVSGRAQIGALTIFIGVLGGVAAFGAIGIFLGPLVLALVIALVRFVLEARAAQP